MYTLCTMTSRLLGQASRGEKTEITGQISARLSETCCPRCLCGSRCLIGGVVVSRSPDGVCGVLKSTLHVERKVILLRWSLLFNNSGNTQTNTHTLPRTHGKVSDSLESLWLPVWSTGSQTDPHPAPLFDLISLVSPYQSSSETLITVYLNWATVSLSFAISH